MDGQDTYRASETRSVSAIPPGQEHQSHSDATYSAFGSAAGILSRLAEGRARIEAMQQGSFNGDARPWCLRPDLSLQPSRYLDARRLRGAGEVRTPADVCTAQSCVLGAGGADFLTPSESRRGVSPSPVQQKPRLNFAGSPAQLPGSHASFQQRPVSGLEDFEWHGEERVQMVSHARLHQLLAAEQQARELELENAQLQVA